MLTQRGRQPKDNSKRKFNGGGPRPDRNVQKRIEAEVRNEAYRAMPIKEKLSHLDRILGHNVGACRQRDRLLEEMAPNRSYRKKAAPSRL